MNSLLKAMLGRLALYGGLALAAFLLYTYLKHQSDLDKALDKEVQVTLSFSRRMRAFAEAERAKHLAAERDREALRKAAQSALAAAEAHRAVEGALRDSLALAGTQKDSLGIAIRGWARADSGWALERVARLLVERERDGLERDAFRAWGVVDSLLPVNDSLEKLVGKLQKRRECRWLVVSCPSRGMVALGTAVVTAIVTSRLRNATEAKLEIGHFSF